MDIIVYNEAGTELARLPDRSPIPIKGDFIKVGHGLFKVDGRLFDTWKPDKIAITVIKTLLPPPGHYDSII